MNRLNDSQTWQDYLDLLCEETFLLLISEEVEMEEVLAHQALLIAVWHLAETA